MSNVPILRAGVGRREIGAAGSYDPLYVKALALEDERGRRAAVLALDAVAIGGICDLSDAFLPALRARLEGELAVDPEGILVNASHTHTPGPMLVDEGEVLERAVSAAEQAFASLSPVVAGAGRTRELLLSRNRTLRLKNGRHATVRQANPCPPDELVEAVGPTIDSAGVLRLDRLDGSTLAVVFTFSCHPLLGVPGGAVTANYPGFAAETIEALTGATAIFLQGSLGDVVEIGFKDTSRPSDSRAVGQALAVEVLRALRSIKAGSAGVGLATRRVALPRKDDYDADIDRLTRERDELLNSLRFMSLNFRAFLPLYIQYALGGEYPSDYAHRYLRQGEGDELRLQDEANQKHIERYLHNIGVMERLCQIQDDIGTLEKHRADNAPLAGEPVPCEIAGVRVGDFVMISSPAEMLVEAGRSVENTSPFEHTHVISPSNGYVHYGAPSSHYGKGGYEVTECMLAPGWQEEYERGAKEVLGRLKDERDKA